MKNSSICTSDIQICYSFAFGVSCFYSGVSTLEMTSFYLLQPGYLFDLSISNADLNEIINISLQGQECSIH